MNLVVNVAREVIQFVNLAERARYGRAAMVTAHVDVFDPDSRREPVRVGCYLARAIVPWFIIAEVAKLVAINNLAIHVAAGLILRLVLNRVTFDVPGGVAIQIDDEARPHDISRDNPVIQIIHYLDHHTPERRPVSDLNGLPGLPV